MKKRFNNFKIYTSVIFKDLFQVSLVTYLILLLMETVKTGFVTFFLDLNWILWIVLVSGIIMALTDTGEQKITSSEIAAKAWHYFFKRVRGRVGHDSQWNFLFKELHAKHLVENDLKFTPKDWYLALRDYEKRQLMKSDLNFLLKEISFRRVNEREWFYFTKQIKQTTLTERDLSWILIISIGGAGLIYYKTQSLGLIALVIAILSFFIIFLLSYLIFTEQE